MSQMMAVGSYVFSVYQDTDFEKLQRVSDGGFSKLDRAGQAPASQQTGQGLETMQIDGQILGNGALHSLNRLRALQNTGKPQQVIDGSGRLLGLWKINRITETRSKLIDNGTALKTGFSVSLEQFK